MSYCNHHRHCPQVKWAVFFNYTRALGTINAILWMVCFLIFQAASVLSNLWLSAWTAEPILQNSSLVNTSEYIASRDLYLGVYGGLGAAQGKCCNADLNFYKGSTRNSMEIILLS